MNLRSLSILCILFPFVYPASAQHQVYSRFTYGFYMHNSENDLRLMKDDKYSSMIGGAVGYAYRLSETQTLSLELGYLESNANSVIRFATTSPAGPEVIGYFFGDAQLKEFSLDASYCFAFTDWLQGSVGPSAAIANRIFRINAVGFEDRLSSRLLGAHVGLDVSFALSGQSGLLAQGGVKMRYYDSISFDARGRNLDNYKQTFLQALGSVGLLYEF